MLENSIKSELVSSEDESQAHYIENAPHLQYMALNKENFEIANAYNLKLRKKKRIRTAFTTDQVLLLENTFSERKYIDKWTRKKLANRLRISEKNVKVWFQNRRMKNKRLSSESSDSGEVNDADSKNNASNESTSWELPYDSASENPNFHNIETYNELDLKNNGIENCQPQFPYGATNEDFYYTELCQQQQYNDAPCVPNFAFNTHPHYCDFNNNNYYYNPIDYDHSEYNYNWSQHFTF